ncbi:hypothetical protein [Dactylosporangium sp. NPDC051541]|uniref:hypothetical protein n=1 Tax=Dactylosporangium sp. NPDC051541 TaxID=3363977 RepID=UPI0037BB5639
MPTATLHRIISIGELVSDNPHNHAVTFAADQMRIISMPDPSAMPRSAWRLSGCAEAGAAIVRAYGEL